jgi:hypothetical protein
MDIEEAFDKLWQDGGELIASMCNGDIKIFAKWFYDAGYKAGVEAMEAENARLKEALKDLLVEAKYLYQYYPNFRQTAEEYFSDEIKTIKAAEEES